MKKARWAVLSGERIDEIFRRHELQGTFGRAGVANHATNRQDHDVLTGDDGPHVICSLGGNDVVGVDDIAVDAIERVKKSRISSRPSMRPTRKHSISNNSNNCSWIHKIRKDAMRCRICSPKEPT